MDRTRMEDVQLHDVEDFETVHGQVQTRAVRQSDLPVGAVVLTGDGYGHGGTVLRVVVAGVGRPQGLMYTRILRTTEAYPDPMTDPATDERDAMAYPSNPDRLWRRVITAPGSADLAAYIDRY